MKHRDESAGTITRRELLRGVGAASAITVGAYAGLLRGEGVAPEGNAGQGVPATRIRRETFEHLTAAEAETLEALIGRLIPADDHGPGGNDAEAIHYIDRALGGALSDLRPIYITGLAALDRAARSVGGAPFHELSATSQDSLLLQVERGARAEFEGGSTSFFEMVRTHTIQGTFSDPFYGGNANFVGWDMVAYPGVRTFVTAGEQRMSNPPARIHKSAYDYEMFTKASASTVGGPSAKPWRLG